MIEEGGRLSADEEHFIRRLQASDEEAWREFMDHYADRMLAYALRHVKNRVAAEDIVEDTFGRVVSSIKGFTYQGIPLDVWVYKIARNAVADYYRKHTGFAVLPFQEFMDTRTSSILNDPYEMAEAGDIRKVVDQAVELLAEPRRSVVRLRLFQGKTVKEASFLLGLSESNVKILLFRALADIRQNIAEKMGERHET
jgi:RNA polymerase sigma factor (sigma-70 family)